MPMLTRHTVTANVRLAGTSHRFGVRTFDAMLDPTDSDRARLLEAKRVIRQIGYEIHRASPVIIFRVVGA